MVSDWQGGDISKLFPALSGKEDLSMGEDKKADKKRKRIVPKAPVQMIISREYVGTQTVTEAFVPIISEDIRKKIAEGDPPNSLRCFSSLHLLSSKYLLFQNRIRHFFSPALYLHTIQIYLQR